MEQMEHKYITSSRGTVHYWISRLQDATAKTIVFTHGLVADHRMFEKQAVFFKDKCNVILWDVPLHGSSRPYTDFSYKNAAEELNSILLAEKIDRVILVGMSMGGYPSQMFGALYPQKTMGFIALDTTPFGTQYYSKLDRWWLKRAAPIAGLFPLSILKKSMAKSVSLTSFSYEMMTKMLAPLTKEMIVEQMDLAYGGFLKENFNVSFPFPVHILVGEKDKTGKVKQYCKKWSASAGYPLIIIKQAAHFSNGDNPERVSREIFNFAKSL